MKCSVCGLEMVIYEVIKREDGTQEPVYVCRNERCPAFDTRLKKE